MLITLVTYGRPRWASAIIAHLRKEAPDALIAVCDNGVRPGDDPAMGFSGDHARQRLWTHFGFNEQTAICGPDPLGKNNPPASMFQRNGIPNGARVLVWRPSRNLGAGGGRNELLRLRLPGEPFVRIDDDWMPKEHGWLAAAQAASKGPDGRTAVGLVRVAPTHKMERDFTPPAKGETQWRLPDCCGPIWLVTGECADALGGFYLGFGATLLDDLEYSRRAVRWQQERFPSGGRGVLEMGWPVRDFGNGAGTAWAPPWDLFQARCEAIRRRIAPLGVPLKQEAPGYEWRRAGREYKETAE